jgi:hypothetical protein
MNEADPDPRFDRDLRLQRQRLQRDERLELRRARPPRAILLIAPSHVADRFVVSTPCPRDDARQLKLRIVGESLERMHQVRRRRPLVRLHPLRNRLLMREPWIEAEQPLARPRAARERV